MEVFLQHGNKNFPNTLSLQSMQNLTCFPSFLLPLPSQLLDPAVYSLNAIFSPLPHPFLSLFKWKEIHLWKYMWPFPNSFCMLDHFFRPWGQALSGESSYIFLNIIISINSHYYYIYFSIRLFNNTYNLYTEKYTEAVCTFEELGTGDSCLK